MLVFETGLFGLGVGEIKVNGGRAVVISKWEGLLVGERREGTKEYTYLTRSRLRSYPVHRIHPPYQAPV